MEGVELFKEVSIKVKVDRVVASLYNSIGKAA